MLLLSASAWSKYLPPGARVWSSYPWTAGAVPVARACELGIDGKQENKDVLWILEQTLPLWKENSIRF